MLIREGQKKPTGTIYINDRGKQHKHINAYLKRKNIPHEWQRLDFGDYQIEGKPIVMFVFDSISDFAKTVCDKKNNHFWKQVSRATKGNDMFLFCLIESDDVHSYLELQEWRDCRKNINGVQLLSEIETMRKYPRTHVLFFDKRDMPAVAVNILGNDLKTLETYERWKHTETE